MKRRAVLVLISLIGLALLPASASALAFGRACACDCTADGAVTVDEIVVSVNAALTGGLDCPSADVDGSGATDVVELIGCIQIALDQCPLVTRADAAFWDTLGLVADREQEALALHQQAIEFDPEDSRSWFLLGMMRLYRFGKMLTDFRSFSDPAQEEIAAANAALDQAVARNPASRNYPGFRGAATFQNGVAHGDPALVELGLGQLRASIELWGFFNRFSFLGTVAAVAPAGDPLFAEAFNYLLASTSPEGLAECTNTLCGNDGKAPSNIAGTFLLFGDIFAKGQVLDLALGWYTLSSGGAADDYPFADLVGQRVASAQQRIALYADDNPDNDPPIIGLGEQNCVICHAR